MKADRVVVLLVSLLTADASNPRATDRSTSNTVSPAPVLRHTCLIARDVSRLVTFYEQILRIPAKLSGADYAEFPTEAGVLAIYSAASQEKYIPHSAEPANNKSAILEFEVVDVDREYARLQGVVKNWVKPPAAQPWGTRSTYFRDPDGNLIDFYAWVKGH